MGLIVHVAGHEHVQLLALPVLGSPYRNRLKIEIFEGRISLSNVDERRARKALSWAQVIDNIVVLVIQHVVHQAE